MSLVESGDGVGGYAREMSPAYQAAQAALFEKVVPTCDVVITTALIPGKPAPKLVTAAMVAAMRRARARKGCWVSGGGQASHAGGFRPRGFPPPDSPLPPTDWRFCRARRAP